MRRARTVGLLGALLVLALLLAAVTVGCGTATQNSGQPQATPTMRQGILQQALANMSTLTSGTGDINVSLTVTGDQTTMPAGAQALLGQPIKISGAYSFDKTAKAAQASLSAAIAGQNLPLTLEAVNGQAWLQFMGQWYETPAGPGSTGETTTTGPESTGIAVQQALTAAGVDPSAWLTNVKLVGDEKIDNATTSHISATVDVSQIASDLSKLAQSGALKNLMPTGTESTESTTPGSSTSETLSAQQEAQQLGSSLTSAVQSLALDVWVTRDTYEIRQVGVKATVNPPAGSAQSETMSSGSTAATESAAQAAARAAVESLIQGIQSVSLDATVSLAPTAAPVKVTPPAGAKSFSDLQTALQGFMNMFSGGLGGGSSSTSAQ